MNAIVNLSTSLRQLTGKSVKQLRDQGKIPAVLYGHQIKTVSLAVDYNTFEQVLKIAGESTLVDLTIDDQKPVKVLIQDYQTDPLSGQVIHVDFHQIKMDEKLHAKIELKFIGESPAVKEFGGILVKNLHVLSVECLPEDLVHEIEVDLSSLKALNDSIHISNLKVPQGIKTLNVADDIVVLVQPPRSEQELADLQAKPEVALPEEVKETEKVEAEAKSEVKAETKPEKSPK